MLGPFEIHWPSTVQEASTLLREHGPEGTVYAGGTELLVLMKEGLAHFPHLIDIKRIPELDGIAVDEGAGEVRIGPLVTHRALERSPVIQRHAPVLAALEAEVANVRVRHAGTLGGNLCFAEPHSDPATLLVAWDARLRLASADAEREVAAAEFFTGLLETAREPDELLTSIVFPLLPTAGSAYLRFKVHERPTATMAITLWCREDQLADARVVAGSVGPKPQRLTGVESLLIGREIGDALFADAAQAAASEVRVDEEGFESMEYKRHLIQVLTSQALQQAAERAA